MAAKDEDAERTTGTSILVGKERRAARSDGNQWRDFMALKVKGIRAGIEFRDSEADSEPTRGRRRGLLCFLPFSSDAKANGQMVVTDDRERDSNRGCLLFGEGTIQSRIGGRCQ
ncbi:hypothetical protein N425_01100 [Tannerella sp. oral taxon BU063 isolate Cell 2]|uniref:Uncharacterized protein n=1 Tax=Tannerella sp. oral taxon BU063 isolate Cell 2 TaxID=1411148 RepID=W2C791_9BACT|nr:hypothetical protein N425_01100 [Tannerella sp. oral taxon BU063 isolate Cell 2]